MKAKLPVTFQFESEFVEASQGQTVLDAILTAGLQIDHSCGGHATCGTCRVFLMTAHGRPLPMRNDLETEFAADRGFSSNERLACQLLIDESWGAEAQFSLGSNTKKGLE